MIKSKIYKHIIQAVRLREAPGRVKKMTTITKSQNGTYIMNENGNETILTLVEKPWGPELQLPDNETGRKYLRVTKAFEKTDVVELHAITRTPSTEPRQTGKKNPNLEDLREYMSDKDYQTITKILAGATEAYKAAHEKKPLTEKEKLQKKLGALQKKLANLTEGD